LKNGKRQRVALPFPEMRAAMLRVAMGYERAAAIGELQTIRDRRSAIPRG
jgi:hypothetical protein